MPPNTPAPDDLGWDLAMLRDLAAAGMKLAKTFAEQTQKAVEEAGIDADSSADPGRPFARMARCVRQTLALRAKLIKDQRTPAKSDAPGRDDRAANTQHRKRKAIVRGAIADFIETTADRGDRERLLSDLDENLDDEEATEDFDTRPIGRLIIEICETLGLEPDPNVFTDEEVGILAFAPGQPTPDRYTIGRTPPGRKLEDIKLTAWRRKRPQPQAGPRGPRPGGPDSQETGRHPPPNEIDPSPS